MCFKQKENDVVRSDVLLNGRGTDIANSRCGFRKVIRLSVEMLYNFRAWSQVPYDKGGLLAQALLWAMKGCGSCLMKGVWCVLPPEGEGARSPTPKLFQLNLNWVILGWPEAALPSFKRAKKSICSSPVEHWLFGLQPPSSFRKLQ